MRTLILTQQNLPATRALCYRAPLDSSTFAVDPICLAARKLCPFEIFCNPSIKRSRNCNVHGWCLPAIPFVEVPGRRRGRPKGATNKPQMTPASIPKKGAKRTKSLEGKARIAAAQKARWAKQKQVAAAAEKTARPSNSATIKKASKPAGMKALVRKASRAKKKEAPVKSISAGHSASSPI